MNEQQIAALRLAIDCIVEAAEIGGALGAPSGAVYAAMSQHGLTLNAYQSLLAALERAGKIVVKDDCIFLPQVA